MERYGYIVTKWGRTLSRVKILKETDRTYTVQNEYTSARKPKNSVHLNFDDAKAELVSKTAAALEIAQRNLDYARSKHEEAKRMKEPQ